MGRRFGHWRQFAGALAACFLAVFALTPAVDAAICEADEPPAVHAVLDHPATATDAGQRGHTDSPGVCAHGHCHQMGSEAPASFDVRASSLVHRHDFNLASALVAVSNRHFRLIRPPRA